MGVRTGQRLTADLLNSLVVTRVATNNAQTAGGTTSGTTELAIDSVTFSAVNGQRYKVRWWFKYTSTIAADRFVIRVRQGSGTGGTELESKVFFPPVNNSSTFTEELALDYIATSTGSLTLQGTVARVAGSGTLTVQGTSTSNRWLTVDLATDS